MHTATQTPPLFHAPELPFASAHLIGIAGSGMKSLAELLGDLGCRLTGSDRRRDSSAIRAMRQRSIRIDAGHDPHFVPPDCEAVIYSPAIGPENHERRMAARLAIPQYSLIDALAGLMAVRTGVCIAGTHGKSSTTALTAWILQHAGLSPSAFIGASLCGSDRGGWAGAGELFVVESCEYDRNFLQLRPKHAVILGIEPDHFGTYPDEASLVDAFAQFAANLPDDGTLLIPTDCPRSVSAAKRATCRVEKFDATLVSRLQAAQLVSKLQAAHSTHIDIPRTTGRLKPGHQLARNTAAAVALCRQLGVADDVIRKAVATFPGIRRRFEVLGDLHGVTFIDDYAHHPTAVRVTLQAARERFPGRKLWCVFQPHQVERTQRLFDDFAEALSLADVSLVTPVFAAREAAAAETAAEVSRNLAAQIQSGGTSCRFIPSLDRIRPTIDDEARPGDVVLLMGAGDIDGSAHEFAGRISRDHHSE